MNNEERREKVSSLFEELDNIFDPSIFIFQERNQEILKEIAKLQNECPHSNKDNYIVNACEEIFCPYCFKKMNGDDEITL
jgi:hypothetical protein